jgi:anaerobic magnesium-protoporphyrin IX monomethyl ester cyclase
MSTVLFTHSYYLRRDKKQWRAQRPYPPLATLIAAACARERGFEVHLHDVMFATSPRALKPGIESLRPRYVVIYDDSFNYLSKMCLSTMREAALEMIAIAKDLGCVVIVSGSDANDHASLYLDAGADVILLGEAEATLVEVLDAYEHGSKSIQDIYGVVVRYRGADVTSPRRVLHTNLDELPLPAWDLVDMRRYRATWLRSTGYFSLNVATTRGCPFRCNWCAKPIYGNRYNVRSPENVMQELEMLRSQYNVDHIWFADDIFGLKPEWVKQFAALTAAHQLRIRFKIQSRADLLLANDTIRELARAGCEEIWIGAESGSQTILDAMDKGITIEQIHRAVTLLRDHNIRVGLFLQLGYLGETEEDIRATEAMLHRLMPDEIGISVSYPLPGTKFYQIVSADLHEKQNWTDSSDLAMMYRGSFTPGYYRLLHTTIHRRFWLKQSQQKKITLGVRNLLKRTYYSCSLPFLERSLAREMHG